MKRVASQELAEQWAAAFPGFADTLDEPASLRFLREEALAHFSDLGLPHAKLEAWRSTSLAPLERSAPSAPVDGSPDPQALLATARRVLGDKPMLQEKAARAVFVDGHLCPEASTLPGDASPIAFSPIAFSPIAFSPTAHSDHAEPDSQILPPGFGELASPKQDSFVALNTAFFNGGGLVEIGASASDDAPIHLLLISSGSAGLVCPRFLVRARAGSRATVVLDFVSEGSGEGLVNAVCEIFVEENASLDCVLLQREGSKAIHIGNLHSQQQRGSQLRAHTVTLGGALVRNALEAHLGDEGAEVDLRGLYIGSDDEHIDNHTLIDHALPHTISRQVYKGVLGDRSRGVFRGLVHVRPNAQKIDSSQSNKNLLLSEKARIDTRPQLEIHADDVKCSHGSTVGKLDEEALFYLRSRGLSENDARGLLTRGFTAEICEALPGQALSDFVRDQALAALSRCGTKEPT